MKIKIVVDSTTNINEKIRPYLTVVHLPIRFGEEEYLDGLTITHKEFYEKLIESDLLPTTSQASPAAFAEVFAPAVEEGYEVVALTVSGKLSGTYQSACIAAADFAGKVHVVDTHSVSIGAGVLAERAVQLMRAGASAAQIVEDLTRERDRVRVIAMLDTLEYLKRGGRISGAVAFAGGLLAIKPVV